MCLRNQLYLASGSAVADATDLIARFGAKAGGEAASRADRSRTLGNVIHYCRWRQVQRIVALFHEPDLAGTIH